MLSNPFGFIKDVKDDLHITEAQKNELEEAVEKYKQLTDNIKELDDVGKQARQAKKEYEQEIIPQIMSNRRETSTTLLDGTVITVGDDVFVTVKNDAEFIKFLEENNAIDKLKYVVEVSATEHEAMKEIVAVLKRRRILYNVKPKMHSASEKKFWRDILLRSNKTQEEIKPMQDIIEKFASVFKVKKISMRKSRKKSMDDIPF